MRIPQFLTIHLLALFAAANTRWGTENPHLIRLQRSKVAPDTVAVRITNGTHACEFALQKDAPITWVSTESLATGAGWKFTANVGDGNPAEKQAVLEKTPGYLEFAIPQAMFEGTPEGIAYQWLND